MRYFLPLFTLLFFLISLSLDKFSYAEFTNFDFSLDSYFIKEEIPLDVDFKYLLSGYDERDFLVRPVIGNGFIEIFDDGRDKWISSFDLLNNLPNLNKSMKIKISRFKIDKTSLSFEIYSIKTGKVYITPKKDVWSKEIYSNYVKSVNSNLDKLKLYQSEVSESTKSLNTVDVAVLGDSSRKNIVDLINTVPKIYFLFFSFGIFLLSITFGIRSVLKKKDIARW